MKWTVLNNFYRKISEVQAMVEDQNLVYFMKPNRQWFLKNEEIILVKEDFTEIVTIKATVIGSRKLDSGIVIECEIQDQYTHINKRNYAREYCEYEAIFNSPFGSDEGIILDISQEGVKLETNLEFLSQGDIIELHFHMEDVLNSKRAIVQWVNKENGRTYLGLKFYQQIKRVL